MAHPTAKFDQPGDFEAVRAAEAACRAAGFSVGPMQAAASRGLMLGDVRIAKWRNLTPDERRALHGQMWGRRDGPVTVMLHADAPPEAVAAFYRLLARSEALRGIEA